MKSFYIVLLAIFSLAKAASHRKDFVYHIQYHILKRFFKRILTRVLSFNSTFFVVKVFSSI